MTSPAPYQGVPTAVVYDVFAETVTTLTALYNTRSNKAESPERRQAWWAKVMELRDTSEAVPAHDRAALIEHIITWQREIKKLESERG